MVKRRDILWQVASQKMVLGALRTEPLYSGGEKLSCYAALEIT